MDSMPTRLHLVRHGAVDRAWRERVYGCLDVPLDPAGEEEARRAAARLLEVPLAAVVSSGLARTRFGAERIAEGAGLAVQEDSQLREIERGEWAGRALRELALAEPGAWEAWQRAPATSRPPGGESLRCVSERVLPRLDHWAARYAGEAVAIVAHLWVIRVAVCSALALSLDAAPRLAVPTGELVVLDWPVVGEESDLRPTLAGFGTDVVPAQGGGWFRGPHRGAR
jgi:broad specificity phosphatase PhoE